MAEQIAQVEDLEQAHPSAENNCQTRKLSKPSRSQRLRVGSGRSPCARFRTTRKNVGSSTSAILRAGSFHHNYSKMPADRTSMNVPSDSNAAIIVQFCRPVKFFGVRQPVQPVS